MPRPEKERTVRTKPDVRFFKPKGIPLKKLEAVELNFDELEALKLCYRDGFYQQDAAKFMNISRQTVGRILNKAMAKITTALVEGRAIAITGGNVEFSAAKVCPGCMKEVGVMDEGCLTCEDFDNIGYRRSIENHRNIGK